jgi:hypothetical protein
MPSIHVFCAEEEQKNTRQLRSRSDTRANRNASTSFTCTSSRNTLEIIASPRGSRMKIALIDIELFVFMCFNAAHREGVRRVQRFICFRRTAYVKSSSRHCRTLCLQATLTSRIRTPQRPHSPS